MKKIYIGTSGWAYDWPNFYPKDVAKTKLLQFYSTQFNSVEINFSFYRLPSAKACKQWINQTPDNFLFAVKLSRYITHIKRLHNVKTALKKFIIRTNSLGTQCGPLLVQLPENFHCNVERLNKFLELTQAVNHELNINYRYALEFRHASWFIPEVFKLLQMYNIALVFSHSPTIPYPDQEPLTTNFVYVRLHGPGMVYASYYSKSELAQWADKIKGWHALKKIVYVYLNNDAFGYAPKNAKELVQLIKLRKKQ